MKRRTLKTLCSLLIAFAPFLIEKTGCIFYWGEPECPETLRNLY
ncbi:MAG: cyclic lactone autoinducer peptide [Tissierellia bacterium]|nr:cyclic lactone autoinducer peptide [Tissierellia bacterium]